MASNSLRCRSREDYPGAHGAIQRSSAFADQLPVLLVCLDPLAGPRIPGNGRPHIRGLPSDRELSRHRQILPDFAQTETTELGSFHGTRDGAANRPLSAELRNFPLLVDYP
jgi:hypothetical protein